MSEVQIGDATGKGFSMKVDNFNRARVFSTSTTQEHHATGIGVAFMWSTVKQARTLTVAGATETPVFILRNNNPGSLLVIQDIYLSTDTANTSFTYVKNNVIGTIANEVEIIGDNLRFDSGTVAQTSAYSWDEAATGLGGLSGGTDILSHLLPAGFNQDVLNGAMDLNSGNSLTVSVLNSGGCEVAVTVRGFFESTSP
jgi:hypothetical protein